MDVQLLPVIEAHPRRLGQHLVTKGVGPIRCAGAVQCLPEQDGDLIPGQAFGARGRVALIAGGAVEGLEDGAAGPVCGKIGGSGVHHLADDLAQSRQFVRKARRCGVNHSNGSVGRAGKASGDPVVTDIGRCRA